MATWLGKITCTGLTAGRRYCRPRHGAEKLNVDDAPVPVLAAGTGKTRAPLGLPARRTLVRRRRRIVPTRLSDPAPEDRTRVKTGENSMPTNGEDLPAAHVHYVACLNTRNGVSGNPSSRDCERPARMVRPAEWNCARRVCVSAQRVLTPNMTI